MKVFANIVLFFFLVFLLGSLLSCRKKMVCPAYTSAFILGQDEQLQYLSQFTDDSIPEIKDELRTFMQKNEFGIVVDVKRKKKWKLLEFVPAEMVMPLVDSTLMDSTGQLPGPGYNRDMIVYNRKFGDLLVFEKPLKRDTTAQEAGAKKKKKKEDDEFDELDEDDPDFDPWSVGDDANW